MDLTRWRELRWQASGTPRTHSPETPESPQYGSAFFVGAPREDSAKGIWRGKGPAHRCRPDTLAAVIAKCPSGALHFTWRDGGAAETPPEHTAIVSTPGGPLYVRGLVHLRSADGGLIVEDMRLALCRCGQSHNKRFCDHSHRDAGFDDPGAVADGGAPAETNDGLSLSRRSSTAIKESIP
jgi:CDGSH-type Zn-finger protein